MKKLESVLRSQTIASGGFLGTDPRRLDEIIAADLTELQRLGYSAEQVADRMQQLTHASKPQYGAFVTISPTLEVATDEHRGLIPCPWPHRYYARKTFTTVRRTDTQTQIVWSDLSIHLIREHHFFQGRGSRFRLEPRMLIETLF